MGFLCRIVVVLLLLSLPAVAFDRVDAFIANLDSQVPSLLLQYQVPSAAIAVIHNGRIVSRSFGVADLQNGNAPSDTTLYNVASISKLVTAWGVMRLVEEGHIELDDPVSQHISKWKLPQSDWNDDVTIRRLLSHTSGLSMPSVPWYEPNQPIPSLPEMLSKPDPVRVLEKPGSAYRYSGGGFAVLQLLIEEVSGMTYEQYVTSEIFLPLGMKHSTFNVEGDAATPYDKTLKPFPHYRFAANAAAGLYTTVQDLALFAKASLIPNSSGVLSPETIKQMQTRIKPVSDNAFGYGLGYSIFPLPAGGEGIGHSGSNEGWTSDFGVFPQTGDALIILMNRSNAFPVYRDLLCNFVLAATGANWKGFCESEIVSWKEEDNSFVDDLFANVSKSDPATAVLVATQDGAVYRKAFGSRNLEDALRAEIDTPFYVASLTKSITSLTALQQIAKGAISFSDPISKYIPDLPDYVRNATIDQLLSHTSGIPDYYSLIDWKHYDGMDNSKVIKLLETRTSLDFSAGSQYAYSNSGYVLVASALERLIKKPFREIVQANVLNPVNMIKTNVYDGSSTPPADRALGYSKEDGKYVLQDYHTVTVKGKRLPYNATTFGGGGMYSTVDDLFKLDRALYDSRILPVSLQLMAMSARTAINKQLEIPETVGHGFGWFLSHRYDTNVIWNTGDMISHHSVMLRIPSKKFLVIILSSSSDCKAAELALQIADHKFSKKQ